MDRYGKIEIDGKQLGMNGNREPSGSVIKLPEGITINATNVNLYYTNEPASSAAKTPPANTTAVSKDMSNNVNFRLVQNGENARLIVRALSKLCSSSVCTGQKMDSCPMPTDQDIKEDVPSSAPSTSRIRYMTIALRFKDDNKVLAIIDEGYVFVVQRSLKVSINKWWQEYIREGNNVFELVGSKYPDDSDMLRLVKALPGVNVTHQFLNVSMASLLEGSENCFLDDFYKILFETDVIPNMNGKSNIYRMRFLAQFLHIHGVQMKKMQEFGMYGEFHDQIFQRFIEEDVKENLLQYIRSLGKRNSTSIKRTAKPEKIARRRHSEPSDLLDQRNKRRRIAADNDDEDEDEEMDEIENIDLYKN